MKSVVPEIPTEEAMMPRERHGDGASRSALRRSSSTRALGIGALGFLMLAAPASAATDLGDLGLEDTFFWEDDAGVQGSGLYSLPTAPATLADALCNDLDQP